jgi:hypothetical protein
MHDDNFVEFINEILEQRWLASFGTLVFVHSRFHPPSATRLEWEDIWETTDPDRENWVKTPSTEWECLEQWLSELGVQHYIWLEERRRDEVRFHVLTNDADAFAEVSRFRWKEISGGWAFERQVDDRLGRLIGHMVMRGGYSLKVEGGQFSGHYTQEDFRPWGLKNV